MSQFTDIFTLLAMPFETWEVKVLPKGGGFLYVSARTVMNRLDEVLGPENWWDAYTPGENSVACRLTIRFPDGTTLTKEDAGGYAGMSDSGDDDKSGYSDALKRAAVKFGVARYLCKDGVPSFAREAFADEEARIASKTPKAKPTPPKTEALPSQAKPVATTSGDSGAKWASGPPTDGKTLYGWMKWQGEKNGIDVISHIKAWSIKLKFDQKIVKWTSEQVARSVTEASRYIKDTLDPDANDLAYEEALAN